MTGGAVRASNSRPILAALGVKPSTTPERRHRRAKLIEIIAAAAVSATGVTTKIADSAQPNQPAG